MILTVCTGYTGFMLKNFENSLVSINQIFTVKTIKMVLSESVINFAYELTIKRNNIFAANRNLVSRFGS